MEASAEILLGVLEHQSTGILWLDASLHLLYLNPAAASLLEIDRRRASDRRLPEWMPEAHAFTAALERAAEQRETFTQRELRLPIGPMPSRHSVTVDCTATPVAEQETATPLLVELIPLDRHLRISREEALINQHAANRILARNLAHEIRNPLGGLRGAAQLLERRLPDAGLREYTQVIMREADRLSSLVETMLGPPRPPRLRWVNVHELTDDVIRLIQSEFPAGMKIERDYDPSLPELQADRDQIVQALLNIARNAREAVGDRGRIRIRTRVLRHFTIGERQHRLVACVDVCDDGPGIPPPLQGRIFIPLVSGKQHGTGLGLSIAQELVNRHGGLIECNSTPGDTVFSIFLPLDTTHEKNFA